MESYKNSGGDSSVAAYEIGADSITVRFTTGDTYLYNYQSAGTHYIEKMKALAIAGNGLNSYIKRRVDKGYASRHC